MNKDEVFVIGDVHGMFTALEKILEHWISDKQQLVFLGDYIDRGEDSAASLQRVYELNQHNGAICLRGNHEQLLLDFLKSPRFKWDIYHKNGGATTLSDILEQSVEEIEASSPKSLANQLKDKLPWLEDWLENLPYYFEFGQFLCVHAGVDLTEEDWRDTSKRDFIWIREPFHYGANQTDKTIIFGHTPVMILHQSYNNFKAWYFDNKIGLDGGAVYGGQLNALRINQNEVIESFEVNVSKEN